MSAPDPASSAGAEVDVLRHVADLEPLAPAWDALAARFRSPVLDHEWFLAAARTLYSDGSLRVVVVRHGDRVTGIAPLAVSRRFEGRLAIVGACQIFEPGGWLYSSDAALLPLTRGVLGLGRVGAFQRLPPPLADRLPALARGRGVAVVRPALPTLGVDTAGGWEAHRARLSPSARKQQKQMNGRLRRAGREVSIVRERPSASAIDEVMRAFAVVEAAGWKGKAGSALAHHPDHLRFYTAYLSAAARRGRAVVSRLHVGAEIAAMELAVQAYNRLWALKIGYDERFATLGPGLLLSDASVIAAFDEGLDGYEFLGAAEDWQDRWAPTAREYRTVTLYPLSARGLAGLGADAVRFVGRKAPTLASHLTGW